MPMKGNMLAGYQQGVGASVKEIEALKAIRDQRDALLYSIKCAGFAMLGASGKKRAENAEKLRGLLEAIPEPQCSEKTLAAFAIAGIFGGELEKALENARKP